MGLAGERKDDLAAILALVHLGDAHRTDGMPLGVEEFLFRHDRAADVADPVGVAAIGTEQSERVLVVAVDLVAAEFALVETVVAGLAEGGAVAFVEFGFQQPDAAARTDRQPLVTGEAEHVARDRPRRIGQEQTAADGADEMTVQTVLPRLRHQPILRDPGDPGDEGFLRRRREPPAIGAIGTGTKPAPDRRLTRFTVHSSAFPPDSRSPRCRRSRAQARAGTARTRRRRCGRRPRSKIPCGNGWRTPPRARDA